LYRLDSCLHSNHKPLSNTSQSLVIFILSIPFWISFFVTLPFMLEANWYKQSFRTTNCQVLFNETSLTTTNHTIIKYRVQFFNNDGQQTITWTHDYPKSAQHQLSNGQVVPCYYFIYETTQPTLLDEPGSNYFVCLVFILIAATVDSLVVVAIGILLLIMAIRMFLSNLPI
jgi:hypothetical protein